MTEKKPKKAAALHLSIYRLMDLFWGQGKTRDYLSMQGKRKVARRDKPEGRTRPRPKRRLYGPSICRSGMDPASKEKNTRRDAEPPEAGEEEEAGRSGRGFSDCVVVTSMGIGRSMIV